MANGIFSKHYHSVRIDHLVDAVVYSRIQGIRPAGQDDSLQVLLLDQLKGIFALTTNIPF